MNLTSGLRDLLSCLWKQKSDFSSWSFQYENILSAFALRSYPVSMRKLVKLFISSTHTKQSHVMTLKTGSLSHTHKKKNLLFLAYIVNCWLVYRIVCCQEVNSAVCSTFTFLLTLKMGSWSSILWGAISSKLAMIFLYMARFEWLVHNLL